MVVNINIPEHLGWGFLAFLFIWLVSYIVLKVLELRHDWLKKTYKELERKSEDPLDDPNSWQSRYKAMDDEFKKTGRSPGGVT